MSPSNNAAEVGIYVPFSMFEFSKFPFIITESLAVPTTLLTALDVSNKVCTFAVVSVTEIICPTNPASAITGIPTSTPSFLPMFITIMLL